MVPFFQKKGYDILKLETVQDLGKMGFFKMIHYGGAAIQSKTLELKPYSFKEEDYEQIVIGSPVWGDYLATPLNTFFKDHPLKDKKLTFVLYSMGGSCNKGVKRILKDHPSATFINLKSPKKDPANAQTILNQAFPD